MTSGVHSVLYPACGNGSVMKVIFRGEMYSLSFSNAVVDSGTFLVLARAATAKESTGW